MQRNGVLKKDGYMLIEALVAMSVLTMSVLGVFALMSRSIKLTRVIDDQYTATYLAAEGIEVTKNLLDANFFANPESWNAGRFSVRGCYEVDINTDELSSANPVDCDDPGLTGIGFDATVSRYTYGVGSPSGFSRMILIVPLIDDASTQEGIRVVSTVRWAGGDSVVALEDKFYRAWY